MLMGLLFEELYSFIEFSSLLFGSGFIEVFQNAVHVDAVEL